MMAAHCAAIISKLLFHPRTGTHPNYKNNRVDKEDNLSKD